MLQAAPHRLESVVDERKLSKFIMKSSITYCILSIFLSSSLSFRVFSQLTLRSHDNLCVMSFPLDLSEFRIHKNINFCFVFRQDVRRAQQTDNYTSLQRFYMRCFDTFAEICALFKVSQRIINACKFTMTHGGNNSYVSQEFPDSIGDLSTSECLLRVRHLK